MCALQYSQPRVIVLDTYKLHIDVKHQQDRVPHSGMDRIPFSITNAHFREEFVIFLKLGRSGLNISANFPFIIIVGKSLKSLILLLIVRLQKALDLKIK